jgi:hypothetical protein
MRIVSRLGRPRKIIRQSTVEAESASTPIFPVVIARMYRNARRLEVSYGAQVKVRG